MASVLSLPVGDQAAEEAAERLTEPSRRPTEPYDELTDLLTEVNQTGETRASGELVPPGTLPQPDDIPQPDPNLVGRTLRVCLAYQSEALPFYYWYDSETGQERLAIVIRVAEAYRDSFGNVMPSNLPLLLVGECRLGGLQGICGALARSSVVEFRVLGAANVSTEEGNFYAYSAVRGDAVARVTNFASPGTTDAALERYLGLTGTDFTPAMLYGNGSEEAEAALQSGYAVFQRMLDRFWEAM